MQASEEIAKLPEWHPLDYYTKEMDLIQEIIWALRPIKASEDPQLFYNLFNKLSTIEKRFERKENQLFPFLEKRGWNGPSQGMWSFHDTLREQFRLLRKKIEAREFEGIEEDTHYLISGISRLLLIEETTLFPNSLKILSEADWIQVRTGEEEIGWMLPQDPPPFPKEEYIHPSQDFT